MTSEKRAFIAHKLYQSRSQLRALVPAYSTRIVEYMRIVDGLAADAGGHRSAGLQVAKQLSARGHNASMVWVLAATVELIEPDAETPVIGGGK